MTLAEDHVLNMHEKAPVAQYEQPMKNKMNERKRDYFRVFLLFPRPILHMD